MLDLNCHESTALVDAHAKKCKLHTEAESARAEAVAQRTSFVDLEESKSRLIPELEELMPCSCQSSSKFDQAKRVSSSLQVVMKLEDRYLRRVRVQKGMRDDQQSLYLPEGGDLGGCRTQDLV